MAYSLNRSCMGAATLALLATLNTAVANAEALTLRPQAGDSSIFGGTRVRTVYRIEGQSGFSAMLGWSVVANRRTLARGETAFTIKPSGVVDADVPIIVPPVNEGAVLAAELTVSIYGGDHRGDAAMHRRPLWIYPRDVFAGRSRWLRSLKIVLFDPLGATAETLDRTEIPYRRVDRAEELASADGIAVVGEGLRIDEYPGLAAAAFLAAQRGTTVLWLAPSGGRFALPGASEGEGPLPRGMAFRDLAVIAELDERLNCEIWTAPGCSARTLAVRCHQNNIVVEVGAGEAGWPWFQVQYAQPEANLVVCCLPLVGHWEQSPAPRVLLLRILEDLNKQ